MTTPAPMTAEQIVEALCSQVEQVTMARWVAQDPERCFAAQSHRDRIKAALVDYIDARGMVERAEFRAKLEEACRGKA